MLLDGETGIVVEGVGGVVHVDERVGEQLAHLAGLEQREIVGALTDLVGDIVEQPRALGGEGTRPGPFIEGLAGRGYRAPGVGETALGHHREGLFGRRVDDFVGLAALRAGPLPGDVHLIGLELLLDGRHRSPPGTTHGERPRDSPHRAAGALHANVEWPRLRLSVKLPVPARPITSWRQWLSPEDLSPKTPKRGTPPPSPRAATCRGGSGEQGDPPRLGGAGRAERVRRSGSGGADV